MKISDIPFSDMEYKIMKAPDDHSSEAMILFTGPTEIDGVGLILDFLSDIKVNTTLLGLPSSIDNEDAKKFTDNFVKGLLSEAETVSN